MAAIWSSLYHFYSNSFGLRQNGKGTSPTTLDLGVTTFAWQQNGVSNRKSGFDGFSRTAFLGLEKRVFKRPTEKYLLRNLSSDFDIWHSSLDLPEKGKLLISKPAGRPVFLGVLGNHFQLARMGIRFGDFFTFYPSNE